LRKFIKPEGEGEIVFIADTVYYNPPEGEKKYQNERYTFAARLNKSEEWQQPLPEILVSELLNDVGAARNDRGDFIKSALREGGYDQIFERLQEELGPEGNWTHAVLSTLKDLQEEYEEGQKFIEQDLQPRIKESFPGYQIDDRYKTSKTLYIHRRDDPKKVTEEVIEFTIRSNSVNIKVGRSKINEDGNVDAAYFDSSARVTHITPPDSDRMNWHFDEIGQVFERLSH